MKKINLDIIKEVANIASGNAITALADLTGKELDIYIPEISKVKVKDIPMLMGNEEDIVVAIYQEILTGFDGNILFAIDNASFKNLLFTILNKYSTCEYKSFEEIDILNLKEMEESIVKEVGNILTGSYLSAISTLIGNEINPSIPNIIIDMAGTILVDLCIETKNIEDTEELFMIKTSLFLDNARVNSQIFLLPKEKGMEDLVRKIKEKYNIYE